MFYLITCIGYWPKSTKIKEIPKTTQLLLPKMYVVEVFIKGWKT